MKNQNHKVNRERKIVIQRSVIKVYNRNDNKLHRPMMGVLAQQSRSGYYHNGKLHYL
jgi:hypothetical protein